MAKKTEEQSEATTDQLAAEKMKAEALAEQLKAQELKAEAQQAQLDAMEAKNDAQAAQLEAQKVRLDMTADPDFQVEIDPDFKRLYWSPARRYRITGYPPEIQNAMGKPIRREGVIQFEDHVHEARSRAEATFIEGSQKFNVDCKQVRNLGEALALTETRNIERALVRSMPIETKVQED